MNLTDLIKKIRNEIMETDDKDFSIKFADENSILIYVWDGEFPIEIDLSRTKGREVFISNEDFTALATDEVEELVKIMRCLQDNIEVLREVLV